MAVTAPPPAWALPRALAPYVRRAVAYDVELGGPGIHRGLPSTELTFVLPVGEPLDCGWAEDPASRGRRWTTVSGLHTAPAAIHHDGRQTGLQLDLTTAGARALLGVPAAALSRELLELDDVTPALRRLPERLAGTASWPARMRLVEQALVSALSRHEAPEPRAELGRALARLTRGARVGEVAEEVGFSRRRLSTVVRAECGVTPKEWQRIARFSSSRDRIARHARRGRVSLASLAAETGYADQAHLTREWQALAGCTPTTWLRTEFPFLQDRGDLVGEGGADERSNA
jgi:AraC-like DNA-binding protein